MNATKPKKIQLKKGVIYGTEKSHVKFQFAIRSPGWEKSYLQGKVDGLKPFIESLLKIDENSDIVGMEMQLRELMIVLQSITHYLKYQKISFPFKMDEYNLMYLDDDADFFSLITAVRNGLVHITQGDGLINKYARISKKAAITSYYMLGEDALFKYPNKYTKLQASKDFRFGCGFHRISLLCHVLPFLEFSTAALSKLPKQKKSNKMNMPFIFENLPYP